MYFYINDKLLIISFYCPYAIKGGNYNEYWSKKPPSLFKRFFFGFFYPFTFLFIEQARLISISNEIRKILIRIVFDLSKSLLEVDGVWVYIKVLQRLFLKDLRTVGIQKSKKGEVCFETQHKQ